MSVAHPQNRTEFKKYIFTKLGSPVIQINVSDEQLDLAIEDAFQFFNERQHFNGTEDVFLRVRVEDTFARLFRTSETENVNQSQFPEVSMSGIVNKLELVEPGSGYLLPFQNAITNRPTTFYQRAGSVGPQGLQGPQGPQGPQQGPQGPQGPQSMIPGGPYMFEGEGLTVNWGESRTVFGGLLSVDIHTSGRNYKVGDDVIIVGGDNNAVFRVTEIKESDSLHGFSTWESQRNYIIMPDSVVGVTKVVLSGGGNSGLGIPGGGVIPGAFFTNPFLTGGAGSGNCGNMGFDLVTYFTLKQWLADMNFLFNNEVNFSFNQRTHRLYLNTHNFGNVSVGNFMLFNCDVKPSPDIFPDLWDDLWVKRYCIALTKKAWGQNLTKYSNVNLPGGITLNGDQIYNEGKEEIRSLEERFALDYADPILDEVG